MTKLKSTVKAKATNKYDYSSIDFKYLAYCNKTIINNSFSSFALFIDSVPERKENQILVCGVDSSYVNNGVSLIYIDKSSLEIEEIFVFDISYINGHFKESLISDVLSDKGIIKSFKKDLRILYYSNIFGFLTQFVFIDYFFIEEFAFHGSGNMTMLSELASSIKSKFLLKNIIPLPVVINTHKKYIGAAINKKEESSKVSAKDIILSKFPFLDAEISYDSVDSICVALCGFYKMIKEIEFSAIKYDSSLEAKK